MKLNDRDIAIVEFMHDRLLEVYNENKNLDYMHNARENAFLYRVISRFFCKHDYHLVNQFEMKSEFDIVVEAGKTPNTWNSRTRRIVTDYKCSKCNNIKRLTAKTPH